MELISCMQPRQRKAYMTFMEYVYHGNSFYRPTMMPIIRMLFSGESVFCRHAVIEPTMVMHEGKPIAAVTFIHSAKLPKVLQLAFFEALPDSLNAVALLLNVAKEKCKKAGFNTIVAGLNGHVNYGFGYLADKFDSAPCFGNAYNPSYYSDYFEALGMTKQVLVSYLTDMDNLTMSGEEKLLKRVQARYRVRKSDFRQLKKEVSIYTRLNNLCFTEHPFCFERTFAEDYELLKGFRLLIRDENLLIVETDGEPVGFMLWYPDFHQVIPSGKEVGLNALMKVKWSPRLIQKFKIAEIGVIPRHQGTGAAMLLFEKCRELTQGRYKWCESSWIIDSNTRSRGFGIRWADQEYKHYNVYEMHAH